METSPKKYIEYLGKTAGLADFADYPSSQRLQDFTAVFGTGGGEGSGGAGMLLGLDVRK